MSNKEKEKRRFNRVVEKAVKTIGVVGSRSLGGYEVHDRVGNVVDYLLRRGHSLATGGAVGIDQFALDRVVERGQQDRCSIFSAWNSFGGFPGTIRKQIRGFKEGGGHVVWGAACTQDHHNVVRGELLLRNIKLVQACDGIVAFLSRNSRGTVFTLKQAAAKRLSLVVFPLEGELPTIACVKWVPLRCGGLWEGAVKAVYTR
ncbi:MAG: hypothetical protein AB7F28_08915 [Candidatus Margulisiibacteriota bacterium]